MTNAEIMILVVALLSLIMSGTILLLLMRRASATSSTEIVDSVAGIEQTIRDEFGRSRTESGELNKLVRDELRETLKGTSDSMVKTLGEITESQRKQFDSFGKSITSLTESNEKRLETIKASVEERLKAVQQDNATKLEEIRKTVDEKLQGTLEKRLSESFKVVSDQLEQVHTGLGEMKTLAAGVGDLKRVMTNVKTRGTWGEIQLGSLLEQVLSPEQYEQNVATKGGSERVEFAIKFPGPDDDADRPVWLPIDAKFPQEDYLRLVDASELGDEVAVAEAIKGLVNQIKAAAKDISSKYIQPPQTTDFAIMFLPTEGLYAEVLRRPGLADKLQKDYRVSIAGPTTLTALLNSFQMGFRTLAIQKRSSEVWSVLGEVKTEFGKFGGVLEKVKKKIEQASNSIGDAEVRSRAIERRLRTVEVLPSADADSQLPSFPSDNLDEGEK